MDAHWQRLRRQVETAIARLIELVDRIDGDADLEETGDLEDGCDLEPSLAALERHPECIAGDGWTDGPSRDGDGAQTAWSSGGCDDREDAHDGAEPDVDDELSGDEDEPSLGSFDRMLDQDRGWRQTEGRNWTAHLNSDLEAEPGTT